MREADEYQHMSLKKMVGIVVVTVTVTFGMFTSRSMADDTVIMQPVEFANETRVELPQNKRQQFRAKLLRSWWQVKQPKYIIYRPLFQKS